MLSFNGGPPILLPPSKAESFSSIFPDKLKCFTLQIQTQTSSLPKQSKFQGTVKYRELPTNLRFGDSIMKLQYLYLVAKVDLMSLFLLPDAQFDRMFMKQCPHALANARKYPFSQQTQKQQVNFETEVRKLGEGTPQTVLENHECKKLMVVVGGVVPDYKNLVSIQFNKLTQQIRVQLHLLSPQNVPFKTTNTRALLQLATKVRNFTEDSLLQASFNLANGSFALRFPLHAGSHAYFHAIIPRGRSMVEYILKNYVEDTLPLLKMVITEGRGELEAENTHNASALDPALKCLGLSHVRMLITQSNAIAEQEIAHADRQRKLEIERVNKNTIPIQEWFHRLSSFFSLSTSFKNDNLPKYRLDFTQDDQRSAESRIAIPVQPKPKSAAENLLVLNHIYVYDLPALKLRMIDEGGFSSIFVTDIKYVCVQPTPGYDPLRFNQGDLSSHQNILLKRVIVKREDDDCSFSRNRHELEIIRAIREPSVFLPKYYNIVNKPNPHSGSLLMDYIPFDTLTGYMRSNRQSMSLRTKLILLYSIVQSLRFLRDQHIVHLDLKPSNIMLYHNLLVKLIDFGESYHPEVCSKRHKPGFTIPYSSPEIFSNQTKFFTSKSDVFSLGVIMFQVLYLSYPYDIFEQTELIDDIMSNYLKKWLFVPEEFEKYGDSRVLRIMNACISKCLSPSVAHRPELDWMAIILRSCIDYLQ